MSRSRKGTHSRRDRQTRGTDHKRADHGEPEHKLAPEPRPRLVETLRRYGVHWFLPLWIPHALLVWRWWFLCDDAFISFRFARNLVDGHGLRYNLGEHVPVEGYSNFLWVIICAVFELFDMSVTVWPCLLSAACATVLLWMVFDTLYRRLELHPVVVALAIIFLGTFPPFATWATGGLATMPFALLVFVTFERLVLRREGPDGIGGGGAALLLALIRVEGVAWVLVILVLAVISQYLSGRRALRPLVVCLLIVGVGFAVYYAWRYWYYGMPWPNTVYQKGNLDAGRLMRGVKYVMSYTLAFLSPLLLLPGSLCALRRKRLAIGLAVAAMAWAFPAYSILVTGDFMAMSRFLVPGVAFAAVLFAWLVADLWTKGMAGKVAGALLAVVAIAVTVLPTWNHHVVPSAVRERFEHRPFIGLPFQSEYERWFDQAENVDQWVMTGKALRSYATQRCQQDVHPSYVVGHIGAIGYYSGMYIYDRNGLVTPEIALGPVRTDMAVPPPGHDKHVDFAYFLKDRPTIVRFQLVAHQDPARIARACEYQAAQLMRAPDHKELYVPDFARISAVNDAETATYAIVWRILPEGSSREQAWEDFAARVGALRTKGHLPPPLPHEGPWHTLD